MTLCLKFSVTPKPKEMMLYHSKPVFIIGYMLNGQIAPENTALTPSDAPETTFQHLDRLSYGQTALKVCDALRAIYRAEILAFI